MRLAIPVLLALMASPFAGHAQTFKWVDERGVVNYGSKPPAGRAAERVDTTSRNTIDTGPVPKGMAADDRRATAAPPPSAPPAAASTPRGMEFDTYVRLQRGMTEGELLQRAGRPDYVALDAVTREIVKSFYYYPTASDPYTTVVIVRGGRIDHIERTKKH